ncbi:hypothetical protein MOD19_01995 [Bacillus atrophaeus]|nr:hypothetical protein [Bacillus atrophaeus]
MHFIGIDSISRVIIVYDPFLFTTFVLGSIAAAFVSLKIFFCLTFKKISERLVIYSHELKAHLFRLMEIRRCLC